jgi:hypothetical protein
MSGGRRRCGGVRVILEAMASPSKKRILSGVAGFVDSSSSCLTSDVTRY